MNINFKVTDFRGVVQPKSLVRTNCNLGVYQLLQPLHESQQALSRTYERKNACGNITRIFRNGAEGKGT